MAMGRDELLAVVKSQLANTIKYSNDEFNAINRVLFQSHNQDLYGDEVDGRSKVVASDHYDMVESDMPPLARIFLGSNKIMSFKPFGQNDREEARQKTEYAHYLIRGQRDSFKILFDFLKEPGFAKCAVLKFYPEETRTAEYVTYEGLTEDELAVVITDLESEDRVDSVEVASQDEREGQRYDVKFKVMKKTKKITIANVPVDSFILTRGASSLRDAEMVGDVCTKRKGQLIAEGFDKKLVNNLPAKGKERNDLEQKRLEGQGGYDPKTGYHWTNEEVEIQYLYCLVDVDEDGVPERRRIVKCGDQILEDEPYGIEPYAVMSQIPMPHVLIGKSRGEYAARLQRVRTAVERGLMDNIYSVTRPRFAVDDSTGSRDGGKVDLDDLMTMSESISGIVRVDGDPAAAIMPLVTPYIGDSALQVIQYLDAKKGQSLGNQSVTQGLSADQFYKETATRFEGMQDMGQAKIELLARVYAETGFRQLFEGVIWTAQHYQDDACEIMVLGQPMTVDPRKWRYEHYCESNVGLGAGDSEQAITNLGVTLQTQLQLMATGSILVDQKKLYNTLDDLSRAMGKADTSRYFNDPEMPQQLLMAQLEQAMAALQQMQMQMQQMQNPLAESETIKAQAKLIEAKSKQEIEAERMQNDMRRFVMEMAQKDRHFAATLAKDLTKIEVDSSQNIPGALI